ncbi:MAG: response regulator [Zetaproteobacteria bacterium]|nr:response regulator [Zetaproteobacteria bacterium]
MITVMMVDDEEHILQSYQRLIRRDYNVVTALSGKQALEMISTMGAPPVIVSDFRMPGMSGAEFFSEVRKRWPDSYRILLTGFADFNETVSSINEGGIQRYLTKPCSPDELKLAIAEGEKLYALRQAEHELLNQTLMGSLNMFVSVLESKYPEVSKRAIRIADYVTQMTTDLKIQDPWSFKVAALVSQFGYLSMPPEILQKHLVAKPLSDEEISLVNAQPEVMQRLVRKIPRMGPVEAILGHFKTILHIDRKEIPADSGMLGALLIFAAQLYDTAVNTYPDQQGDWHVHHVFKQNQIPEALRPVIAKLKPKKSEYQVKGLMLSELRADMITAADVRTTTDMKLLSQGQTLTRASIEQLLAYDVRVSIAQPVMVHVPILTLN